MAITTTDSFLKVLRKSRLLTNEQIEKVRETAGQSDNARSLAKSLVRQKLLTAWQAGQLLAGPRSFFLGKYKLIDLLGSGGMGRVFYAEHTTMNRPVALKIISKDLGSDPALVKRFLTEARAIAALDHPNIVHAYNVDRNQNNRYYIVMEYVKGRNLQQIVEDNSPLDFLQAANYIRQAADGLAHAHAREMIHCDVKPSNLLVNQQSVVKILDMGMARLVDPDGASVERNPSILGSVDYLAPEQAMDSPDMDHRVDIYSLGCTLYFLLTGRPPLAEGTLMQRIVAHQTEDPVAVTELRPDAPEALVAACEKMLAKSPDDRIQSAQQVSQALAAWEASQVGDSKQDAAAGLPPVMVQPADGPQQADAPNPFGINIDTAPAVKIAEKRTSDAMIAPRGASDGKTRNGRRTLYLAVGGVVGALALIAGLVLFLTSGGDSDEHTVGPGVAPGSDVALLDDGDDPTEDEAANDARAPESLPEVGSETEGVGDVPEEGPSSEPDIPEQPPAEEAKPPGEEPEVGSDEPGSPTADPAQPPVETEPNETQPPVETEPAVEPEPPLEPEPKVNPLADLATAVGLPTLVDRDPLGEESRAPLELGRIHAGDDVPWRLTLLGGETALRGDRQFVVSPLEPGPADASWAVRLEGSSPALESINIALLRRSGEALEFQWTDDAEASSANYLQNCLLKIVVDGETKQMALTEPLVAEPVVVDLTRGTASVTTAMRYPPEAALVRMRVTSFEGRDGCEIRPVEAVEAGEPVLCSFPRTDRHENVPDRVDLQVTCQVKRTGLATEVRLVQPNAQFFKQFLIGNPSVEQLAVMRDQGVAQRNEMEKEQAKARGAERSKLLQAVDQLDLQIWYLNFLMEVQNQAKIHYEVFFELEGQEVILAATQPGLAPPVEEGSGP